MKKLTAVLALLSFVAISFPLMQEASAKKVVKIKVKGPGPAKVKVKL